MFRHFPLAATLGLMVGFFPTGQAAPADSALTQEVHELRRDVQMQAKKIEVLSDQILRLTQIIEERKNNTPVSSPPSGGTAGAPGVAEIARAKPEPRPEVKTEPEIPKAEAVQSTPTVQHTVAKGETLTSIAKQYNVPLSDLQKLNKITNDRKLQIGQTLSVPAPAASKTPDAPTEKKDNP
jgi:LysM repeat protein